MTPANWTAIIVACLALIGTISTGYMMLKAKRTEKKNSKKGNNPGPNTGPGFLCYAHGERLMKIELENERVARELVGLQNEIAGLRSKIK